MRKSSPGGGIIIRHGHVLTMDPEIGDLADGDLLIQGSQIAAVGPPSMFTASGLPARLPAP